MRLVFSCTPAAGHLIALLPLARAARDAGHDVAIMTSAGMQSAVESQLSGTTFLPAGAMMGVIISEVTRSIPEADFGGEPNSAAFAEFFAGARVDLSIDDALEALRSWKPDLVAAERMDFVGPLAAAMIGIPFAAVEIGPATPEEFHQQLWAIAAPRYADRGVAPQPPIAVLDPIPEQLQAPDWKPEPLVIPVSAESDRGDSAAEPASPFPSGRATTVLIALGPLFADDPVLNAVIDSIAPGSVNVIAAVSARSNEALPEESDHLHYERLRPVVDLLPGVDIVVGGRGSTTVLAALGRGIPLVLIPHGPGQFVSAERAALAGAAVVVQRPEAVGAAVARIASEPSFSAAASAMHDDMTQRPTAAAAIETLVSRVSD